MSEEQKQDQVLPSLRKDLDIQRGGPFPNGAPSWLIHDGIRNRYFRVGETAYKLLIIWQDSPMEEFVELAERIYGGEVGANDVDELLKFLLSNNLTLQSADGSYIAYFEQYLSTRKNLFSQVLHNYLFFKIPLWRPQKFLDITWPFVRPLFTKTFAIITFWLGVFSLYLVSRQWDVFQSTFVNYLSLEGAALYLVSLIWLKILHELGHAYFATKHKVPVPTIGVAFLVMFPVLYTDTTGAARLHDPRQRLSINIGGIVVELAIAVFATLAWVFLPDGPLRGIAFTTATLSWIMSLAVNLNPFMRFDGYYILSDMLRMENLQARGFAIARWRMREILFGGKLPPPEVLPKKKRRLLIAHAWGTWIYRFFLFLGIALLVYHFFIKLVGILLFVVEIYWFIALPIWREMKVWWQERASFSQRRVFLVGAITCMLLVLGLMPISSRIDVASVARSPQQVSIYPPDDGQIAEIKISNGQSVQTGDLLIRLKSPKLESDLQISELELIRLQARLDRALADASELSVVSILTQQRDAERENLLGLRSTLEQLEIRAPFDGKLENVDGELHKGQWISAQNAVALIRVDKGRILSGLVSGEDAERIEIGNGGSFMEDGRVFGREKVQVASISKISEQKLEHEILADTEGGIIPTRVSAGGEIELVGSWYRVDMAFDESAASLALANMSRGVATINGQRRSFLGKIGRRATAIIIRESGF